MIPSTNKALPRFNWIKILAFFFAVFILFMIIGVPLGVHYGDGEWETQIPDKSATEAFLCLGIGCFLWILVIALYINSFILSLFRKKKRLTRLMQDGRHTKGTVITKQLIQKMGDNELLLLEVTFKNFSGTEVTTALDIVDIKPEEKRFDPGKTVPLIIDPEVGCPGIIIEGKGFQWNKTIVTFIISVLLLLLLLPPGLLVYSYVKESRGYGWRYLDFGHPFLLIPFIMLIGFILYFIIKKIFSKRTISQRLLLYGQSATATIINTSQTGLYINEQPQVFFTIEFEGARGRVQQVSFKKVINLLKIPNIVPGKTIEILYDPKDPQQIEMIN